ncbi:MAG: transposase [Nitrospirota bacterium]
MARQLRIEYEGAFYHITSRGNQKGKVFWDKKDKKQFIDILKRTKDRYGYLLHAYVFMDNHYHLLIETPHANIKQIMQNINTSYTVYVNIRHKRRGHLFQGRYKSFIVDKESYLLELGRYIHLNPVRAGIVQKADDYRWSSYKEYINGKRKNRITNTDDTLYLFSEIRSEAINRYREFVFAGIKEESPLSEASGSVLGNESFTEKALKYLKGYHDKKEIPDIKRIESKYQIDDVVRIVAEYYGVKEEDLFTRKRATAKQRKMAIYLCKILSARKNGDIGRAFGIGIQAVTNVMREIEHLEERKKEIASEILSIKKTIYS